MTDIHQELILILDFGSQYTQLIARRVREQGVYSEIKPYNYPVDAIASLRPKGIILSGGPASVYQPLAPLVDRQIFELSIPILGICYGLQLICHLLGGEVAPADHREYGDALLRIKTSDPLVVDLPSQSRVWMSHGDRVVRLPERFWVLGSTANSPYAIIRHRDQPIYGLQFHPEVAHTEQGNQILRNFLYRVAACHGLWTPKSFINESIEHIRQQVGDQRAICALSGGVDSSVAAVLVHRAIGDRLTCVFVNNGLLRRGEADQVQDTFERQLGLNFRYVDASHRFLDRLKGVIDPEQKRKIIGEEFIRTFEKVATELGDVTYLVQGTLYPDVIESVSTRGPSAVIKTHHNVGGLPEKMNLKLIEPLRELFKDEVRQVGRELGLSPELVGRHPFPGPGLAVRILGEVTSERLEILRHADQIFIHELRKFGWYDQVWQAFAVLLPVQSVGVMGDERTYEDVIALRAVTSEDAMTADWARLPSELLATVANRIINEVQGVNRVVYDISSKPPSTIEWE
ncbi:MAG: glutamine-hydrolyzing GMP synthase [candidate division KSB1 bacterium]|nr:glutamine-hydrolyzing GMP synthase [candidate division KSB1 bacterium]MDZ7335587.1 glutamine-hydrolyzing GMP synthase [candidate division KSB1 bacterium]MDZ7356459.1 glutamine-hydrolyzing GMP synthase [candidate division KSB1 bacterium]MDZ7375337.1 glutamine-hydrolyzing GMP synthase [candidate division KSB1 bacterium]MDZ7401230.1 glutamine-hydrolyzing GMP synthase [candidate division KSB1 bacterium]